MATVSQPCPVALIDGSVVGRKWKVVKGLGSGCYSVEGVGTSDVMGVLKAESNSGPVVGGPVLKRELEVLNQLKGSDHIPTLLGHDQEETYRYVVVEQMGECLCNLLRAGQATISTQTRIGLQVLHGLKAVHDAGFVHRDIKPANLALGSKGAQLIHILNFGLCFQYVLPQEGKILMRRPRGRAYFRGAGRYSSVATHDSIEQGRVDDLWSLLYVMAECRNRLPWANISGKSALAQKKRVTTDHAVLFNSSVQLLDFAQHLRTLSYYLRPDYKKLYSLLNDVMKEGNYKFTDPWDWDKPRDEWKIEDPETVFAADPFGF